MLKLSRTINQKFGAGLEASQASALEAKASASSRRDDVYRKLLQLGELRDKGIITEEEFEAEKRKLMEQD